MPMDPSHRTSVSWGFWLSLAAWILFFLLLFGFFTAWQQKQANPNADLESRFEGRRVWVKLRPDRGHHYRFPGYINGHRVHFLLDTGASHVVIPMALAERLKLVPGIASQAQTAAGAITVHTTVIDTLKVGEIQLHQVRASLNHRMSPQSDILLGMSALRRLTFEQHDGVLYLIQTL